MKHAAVAASLFLAAVSLASAAGAPPSLSDILATPLTSPEQSGLSNVRFSAVKETGLTYGAQAGLARRSYEIQQRLESQAANLDVINNFQALMIEGNVVPPVLSETSDVYDQSSEDMLRMVGKVYRIEQQARFVYTPPTWRQYLTMSYDFDPNVVAMVSPKNAAEQDLWNKSVAEGYKLGVAQAESILKDNMARLNFDLLGMIRYHRMLKDGLVTKPFVGSSRKGVVRAADGSMHVGEVFLRITASPDFVTDPTQWRGGKSGSAAERLKQLADPGQGDELLREARKAGVVREQGR